MGPILSGAVVVLMIVLVIVAWSRRRPSARRRRRISVGPGAAGAFYGFLNEDKRAAIEIVVEERAAYRDPEDRDGDLPQLERPTKP
jgi:hypothetical protein